MTEEFFKQGDTERQFGMPISPLCDRHNSCFERSQIGFLEFVVLPLYSAVREVIALADFDSVLDRIQHNMATWKERAEQLERQQQQNEPSPGATSTAAAPSESHQSPAATTCGANTIQDDSVSDRGSSTAANALVDPSSSKEEVREGDGQLPEVIAVVISAPRPLDP